ncbi:MAG: hypothetical protein KM296_05735 [Brockia lithotrophica]|nr:hypothetical protein [Brockia lithotrophica]
MDGKIERARRFGIDTAGEVGDVVVRDGRAYDLGGRGSGRRARWHIDAQGGILRPAAGALIALGSVRARLEEDPARGRALWRRLFYAGVGTAVELLPYDGKLPFSLVWARAHRVYADSPLTYAFIPVLPLSKFTPGLASELRRAGIAAGVGARRTLAAPVRTTGDRRIRLPVGASRRTHPLVAGVRRWSPFLPHRTSPAGEARGRAGLGGAGLPRGAGRRRRGRGSPSRAPPRRARARRRGGRRGGGVLPGGVPPSGALHAGRVSRARKRGGYEHPLGMPRVRFRARKGTRLPRLAGGNGSARWPTLQGRLYRLLGLYPERGRLTPGATADFVLFPPRLGTRPPRVLFLDGIPHLLVRSPGESFDARPHGGDVGDGGSDHPRSALPLAVWGPPWGRGYYLRAARRWAHGRLVSL